MDFFGIEKALRFQEEMRNWRQKTDKHFYEAFKKSNEENEAWINEILKRNKKRSLTH